MNSKSLKTLRTGAVEVAAGSLLAMVFLGLLLVAMNYMFPDATGIGELVRTDRDTADIAANLEMQGFDDSVVVAHLTGVRNTVKDRPVSSVTWTAARSGLPLTERHSVQSYGRAGATIEFDDGDSLNLGEHTLIVVRGLSPARGKRPQRASLMFVEGELRGTLSDKRGDGTQLEVFAGGATVRAAADRPDTDFKLASGPDDEVTLMVYDGQAEITWGDRTTVVDADHAVDFSPTAAPGAPRRIPATPTVVAPAEGSSYAYRAASPEVRFQWHSDEDDVTYRVQIARDEEFENLILDERTDRRELAHGALEAGEYFWRVTAYRGVVEGRSSPVRSLAVAVDRNPPALIVELPDRPVTGESLVLRGRTEPGNSVVIGEATVDVDPEGGFEYLVALRRGYNVIVVQAVDPLGNTAFESKLVNASY